LGFGGDLPLVAEAFEEFRVGFISEEVAPRAAVGEGGFEGDDGVTEDGEVGAATLPFHGVWAVGFAFVEVGGECGGEVPARGEAPDADAFGIEAEILGAGADGAEGPLGVLEGGGVLVFGGVAVFEDESGDAVPGEPFGDVLPLVAQGEPAVAAAGADDDAGAVGLAGGGKGSGEGGFVAGLAADGAGGAFGPEELAFWRGGLRGAGDKGEGEEQRGH
jgi:hypothetical protein